jgi:hypothetical protein
MVVTEEELLAKVVSGTFTLAPSIIGWNTYRDFQARSSSPSTSEKFIRSPDSLEEISDSASIAIDVVRKNVALGGMPSSARKFQMKS